MPSAAVRAAARAIYNFCFRRVGDWAVAEICSRSWFLEAWRRRDKELLSDKVLPWLYGIATNVIRNRRRSERRFSAALRRVPNPDSEPSFDELADARIDDCVRWNGYSRRRASSQA